MSAWIEVSMRVDGESAEAIAEVLSRFGHQGVSLEQEGIPADVWDETEVPPPQSLILRAYLPDNADLPRKKRELERALASMRLIYPMPAPSYAPLDDQDWAEAWKANYHPVRIGRRLLIRPAWVDAPAPPDAIEIALDPGMAFGTGTHPTTQLCLEALEELIQPAQDVLDLGAGSGILAIAAAKLGAGRVLALDIDPVAVTAARDNGEANGVSHRVVAQRGGLDSLRASPRRFDLLLVNILARTITQLAEQGLSQVLRPGGSAIFSGVIASQIDAVEDALRANGLNPIERRQMGDWMLIVAKRPLDSNG